ncbi:hypothetical protein JNW91_00555 [Micromonospora sp. STR1_7]|uniref:Uncharacterized protein n=1 Tax=Micromonospora parastrephiae TaxID=2806101 RepID=A0ABS1XMK5_9ACTN|nr:hypothetical protein [Micromonospora parastrephiae]MBM0230492.1 hypothetical protein [Micromonospora parastrephiae]
MGQMMGSEIDLVMARLGERGFDVNVEAEDELRTYRVSGSSFLLRVGIGVKGILLDFVVDRDGESPELRHSIDTDLYDVSDPRQRWFADEIERDITSFLDALRSGSLKLSRGRNKTTIVFPNAGKYVRVERGRMFTSRREYERAVDAEADDQFQPFDA